MEKTSEVVFTVDGEISESKMRGALLKWARELDEVDLRNVRYNPGDDPVGSMSHDFKSWVNDRVDDNFWDFLNEYDYKDDLIVLFHDMISDEGEFYNLCDRNLICVEGAGAEVGRGFNPESIDGGPEDDEDKVADNQFPNLTEIGVYDPANGIDYSILKGTILAYIRQNDELIVGHEEPNVESLMTGWVFWMSDKVGGEWTHFCLSHVNFDDVCTWIRQWRINKDGWWDEVRDKWVYEEGVFDVRDDWREEKKELRRKQRITGYEDYETENGEESDNNVVSDDEKDEESELPKIDFTGSDIVHGDSRKVVRSLNNDYGRIFDGIITDPPYGMDYDSRGDSHDVIAGDSSVSSAVRLTRDVLKKSRMLLKKGSPIVIFCGDSNLRQMMDLMEDWFDYKDVNVWNKKTIGTSQIGGTPVRWRPQHEYFVLGTYGKPRHENANRHDGGVLDFQRLSGHNMDHPTEKPTKLLRYIIESLTREGEVIFDPFAGSGSTLVAAKETGRGYFGVEYDESFYNHIVDRLEQTTMSSDEDKGKIGAWTDG